MLLIVSISLSNLSPFSFLFFYFAPGFPRWPVYPSILARYPSLHPSFHFGRLWHYMVLF